MHGPTYELTRPPHPRRWSLECSRCTHIDRTPPRPRHIRRPAHARRRTRPQAHRSSRSRAMALSPRLWPLRIAPCPRSSVGVVGTPPSAHIQHAACGGVQPRCGVGLPDRAHLMCAAHSSASSTPGLTCWAVTVGSYVGCSRAGANTAREQSSCSAQQQPLSRCSRHVLTAPSACVRSRV
jgi:hypothetical protein